MKNVLKTFTYLVVFSLVISCNGHIKKDTQTLQGAKNSVVINIPVSKYGFSNAYLDKDGSLWFSSNGGGVFHLNEKKYTTYTEKDGLSSNQVYAIVSDQENNVWFGTQNGLTKYNRKNLTPIPLPYQDTTQGWFGKVYPILSPNAVHALELDNKGNLWIGTAGAGAYKYDGKNFTSYLTKIGRKQEDSLYHNWIPYIKKDTKGNLWFASMTHGGVNRFDGEKFTQFLIKDGLSDSQVRTIYADKSGNIWMGFNGNRNSGLTVYNGNTFKTYWETDGLCNKRVRAIYKDQKGNLWLGSNFGNLCIFDGQNFTEFNYYGETFSDIFFIIGDLENNIWFGGTHGIWKYNGKTLTKITTDE